MSTALANQINYFIKRAMDINKQIGGKAAYQSMNKNKDEFVQMKEDILAGFHYIKEKLKEKEKKRVGAEHIRIDNEILDKLSELERILDRMNESLKKSKNPSEKNMQTYEYLRTQLLNYKELMESPDTARSPGKGEVNLTITDIRSGLLDDAPGTKKKGAKRIRKYDNKPTTQFYMYAMDRWKKNDEKIDEQVGKLIDKTEYWKIKTIKMGYAIDQTSKQIDTLNKKVDDVNKDLVVANKQLKNIVEKFRKPHRCCIDIFLLLLLVGFIVGIVHYSKK